MATPLKEASLWHQTVLPLISLFTSITTLLCCALPALLVSLGMGAVLAGLVSNLPWITALSDYKLTVFIVAGVLIVFGAGINWFSRHKPCPADPAKGKMCMRLRQISWFILGFSALFYVVGVFFAYFAADILL